MIAGIGADIAESARIKKILEKNKEAFISRICTPAEIKNSPEGKNAEILYYAGRWAAKEAISKALGCGIGPECHWKDIEIINDINGKPIAQLSGQALEKARKIGVNSVHISISHENKNAIAFAVLEKI